MNYSGVYIVRMDGVSISTNRTLVQINAAATAVVEILRASITINTTTSAAQEVGFKRVSTAGTGTGATPTALNTSRTVAAGASSNHTAEGTLDVVLFREWINALAGWTYLPVPEERIIVPPSQRIALYFPTAPGSALTVNAEIVFGEIG